ncbi:molecular chaperone DnaJ [Cryptosporidium felis]|nr:molecular chaperone DnaJ [Cryptosporidium felis]
MKTLSYLYLGELISTSLLHKLNKTFTLNSGLYINMFNLSKRCLSNISEDPHKVLGVSEHASRDEIKRKFRELAKKYHPDVNPSKEAKNKMAKITSAYETLINSSEKLNDGETRKYRPNYSQFKHKQINIWKNHSPWVFHNIDELLNKHLFHDFFETSQSFIKEKGNLDIYEQLELDIFDSINGTNRAVKINQLCKCIHCDGTGLIKHGGYICSNCNGSGRRIRYIGALLVESSCIKCYGMGLLDSILCFNCNGDGSITNHKSLVIEIPKGIKTGQRIIIPKKGHFISGNYGDLIINVKVKPHSKLIWVNNDIHIYLPISLETCMKGGEIQIPDLKNGNMRVAIPPKTDPNVPFILTAKGPPIFKKNKNGDYIIHFITNIPPHSSGGKLNRLNAILTKTLSKLVKLKE